jgi:hypothetical protein
VTGGRGAGTGGGKQKIEIGKWKIEKAARGWRRFCFLGREDLTTELTEESRGNGELVAGMGLLGKYVVPRSLHFGPQTTRRGSLRRFLFFRTDLTQRPRRKSTGSTEKKGTLACPSKLGVNWKQALPKRAA